MTYRFTPERPREPSAPPTVHDQTAPGIARSSGSRVRLCARASRSGPLADLLLAVHDDGLVLASPLPAGLAVGANEVAGPVRT